MFAASICLHLHSFLGCSSANFLNVRDLNRRQLKLCSCTWLCSFPLRSSACHFEFQKTLHEVVKRTWRTTKKHLGSDFKRQNDLQAVRSLLQWRRQARFHQDHRRPATFQCSLQTSFSTWNYHPIDELRRFSLLRELFRLWQSLHGWNESFWMQLYWIATWNMERKREKGTNGR